MVGKPDVAKYTLLAEGAWTEVFVASVLANPFPPVRGRAAAGQPRYQSLLLSAPWLNSASGTNNPATITNTTTLKFFRVVHP
jgi:hypothetical protein